MYIYFVNNKKNETNAMLETSRKNMNVSNENNKALDFS